MHCGAFKRANAKRASLERSEVRSVRYRQIVRLPKRARSHRSRSLWTRPTRGAPVIAEWRMTAALPWHR